MEDARIIRINRYLSKHLRHRPQRLGLTLEPGGWVAVDDLLAACVSHGMARRPRQAPRGSGRLRAQ
jgi:putative RNA 2'-phosphotransferase